ncbi:MAG: glycosyltransferase family 2 protein [Candidatus Nomurabacteria bacterium]|jgi:glycosyltransferase involved in cell wall biosynthesis|nr:glycosyltransferase family 2 protein [Candidatus Nomurabacteria bacterium]
MKKITILIPCYNEQEVLPKLFPRLDKLIKSQNRFDWELLFVNDGSRDQTFEKIKKYAEQNKAVSYINLARNFGKEIAMAAGIDNVKADALIIIDADLQDPPELIPDMIKIWLEGYDDVYARRRSRAGESFLKKFTSSMYYKVLQKSTRIPIQQDTGDFRLLDKKCIKALQSIQETNRSTKALFSWIGYKKKEILYDRDPRAAGQTKWNYVKLVGLAIDGIVSFTTAPLRVATFVGFLVALFAFIYLIVVFIKTMVLGIDEPGYPSLMIVILFLGGIQLITIGIIGEYIGRIFVETKNRPLYLIESKKLK